MRDMLPIYYGTAPLSSDIHTIPIPSPSYFDTFSVNATTMPSFSPVGSGSHPRADLLSGEAHSHKSHLWSSSSVDFWFIHAVASLPPSDVSESTPGTAVRMGP